MSAKKGIEVVTLENMELFLDRYACARGGELNEETDSEAMFAFHSKYRGVHILNTGLGPMWTGVQNASCRWTNAGNPFSSVRSALEVILFDSHPLSAGREVVYSESCVAILSWAASKINEAKNDSSFLLYGVGDK